jgi:hypothetical protein
MANFKEHKNAALLISFLTTPIAGFILFSSLQNDFIKIENILSLFSLFGLVFLGGVLPDIDSKKSIPAKFVFNTISLLITIFLLHISYSNHYILQTGIELFNTSENEIYLHIIGSLLFFPIRFIIRAIFFNYTIHRGIIHSVPMSLLLFLSLFMLGEAFSSLLIISAPFVALNFIVHLLYDEYYSIEKSEEGKLRFKKSFGTALTIYSKKQSVDYLLLYSLIISLFIYNYQNLYNTYLLFFKTIL